MTTQIMISNSEILDLESLSLRQAREKIERLYRSIRSEKIRSLTCEMLRSYFLTRHSGRLRHCLFAGVGMAGKRDLEMLRIFGDTLEVHGLLAYVITRAVTPELARETIKSVSVAGLIFAPQDVWDALQDRIQAGVHIPL